MGEKDMKRMRELKLQKLPQNTTLCLNKKPSKCYNCAVCLNIYPLKQLNKRKKRFKL